MHRLLEAVRAGEVGGICAGWLDRLSREPSHGEWLVKEVLKHGGVVIAPDIPQDITSASGRMTFRMLLDVAAFIRDTARERFTISKIGSIRSGVPVSQAPVGYRRICDGSGEVDRKDRRLGLDTRDRTCRRGDVQAPSAGRGPRPAPQAPSRADATQVGARGRQGHPGQPDLRRADPLPAQQAGRDQLDRERVGSPRWWEALWEAAQRSRSASRSAGENPSDPVALSGSRG